MNNKMDFLKMWLLLWGAVLAVLGSILVVIFLCLHFLGDFWGSAVIFVFIVGVVSFIVVGLIRDLQN